MIAATSVNKTLLDISYEYAIAEKGLNLTVKLVGNDNLITGKIIVFDPHGIIVVEMGNGTHKSFHGEQIESYDYDEV